MTFGPYEPFDPVEILKRGYGTSDPVFFQVRLPVTYYHDAG